MFTVALRRVCPSVGFMFVIRYSRECESEIHDSRFTIHDCQFVIVILSGHPRFAQPVFGPYGRFISMLDSLSCCVHLIYLSTTI